MRILLATEPGGGGVGRHVVDLRNGLVQRGHDVEVVYSPYRAEPWFLAALRDTNCRLHPVDIRRAAGWRDAVTARHIRRLLKRSKPFDIVHGHSSKAGALLRIAATGTRARRVYTPHALVTLSPDLSRRARAVYGVVERVLSRFAEGIICVSEEERQHATRLGMPVDRLYVVNNGLDGLPPASRSDVRKMLGIARDEICVGFVGRLAAQKAAHRLISAFHVAAQKTGKLRLVIVGDGEDLPSLKEQSSQLGIANRVVFTSDSRGSMLMAGFDVFALPSRYEAFPYVFLEAAARGLPIVTTDVGGASAVVRPGINGWIVAQGRLADFPGHLTRLATDNTIRADFGRQSKAIAGEFTLDAMVGNTLAAYRRILDAEPVPQMVGETG